MYNTDSIKNDFDELAKIYHPKWDHNIHYYKYLLSLIPPNCKTVLDVGCGSGDFTRLLASKCEKVLGVDISPEMISNAKSLSKDYKNIEFEVADVFEKDFTPESFDCVVSIATFHHYCVEHALQTCYNFVKPGGFILVLDIYKPVTIFDYFISAFSSITNVFYNITKNGFLRNPKPIRDFWKNHSKNEKIPTLLDVEKAAFRVSCLIKVRRLFFNRYLIAHKKSEEKLF